MKRSKLNAKTRILKEIPLGILVEFLGLVNFGQKNIFHNNFPQYLLIY